MAENQEATPKKILIVEDEEYLRDLYVELLTEAGYDVDSASAGKEGYVKMKRGGYDLVLLDIMLPEIDGLEILKRLTEAPSEKPNKNIVLLTNLSKDLTISRGVALGIQGYIIKSDLTPGQFIKEIKTYFLNWMAEISLNSHDLLGKLGLIRNLLAVVLESENPIGEKSLDYIKKASETNQSLIDLIKSISNG